MHRTLLYRVFLCFVFIFLTSALQEVIEDGISYLCSYFPGRSHPQEQELSAVLPKGRIRTAHTDRQRCLSVCHYLVLSIFLVSKMSPKKCAFGEEELADHDLVDTVDFILQEGGRKWNEHLILFSFFLSFFYYIPQTTILWTWPAVLLDVQEN